LIGAGIGAPSWVAVPNRRPHRAIAAQLPSCARSQGFSTAAERRTRRAPRAASVDAALALAWLLAKHEAELRMMKGQVGVTPWWT
jgi:alpha-D-ribose 1-methylphosphonate 5-triphosphate synthase subunit PhnG